MTKRQLAFRQSRCPQRTCLCEVTGQVGALQGTLATKLEVSLDQGQVLKPDQLEEQQRESLCDATLLRVVGGQSTRLLLTLTVELYHSKNACLEGGLWDL